jgi:hypothetical protein
MPLRIGILAYPAAVLVLLLLQSRGPVGKFLKAGAISPDTARKPRSLELTNREAVEAAVKSGVLVRLPDGRIYVNLAVHRRRRAWLVGVVSAMIAGFLVALTWLVFLR